jgi:hypothetical protein
LFEWTCEDDENNNLIWLANPSAVNCINKWWILEKDGDTTNCNIWWQVCEQWAYFRWECNIEVATKLETWWNAIYEKYTNGKSSSYKKLLLESLDLRLEDLVKYEVSSIKVTLLNHLKYLINETLKNYEN